MTDEKPMFQGNVLDIVVGLILVPIVIVVSVFIWLLLKIVEMFPVKKGG